MHKIAIDENPMHEMDFFSWMKVQVESISKFSNLIEELKGEQIGRVVSPMKIYECAAKFTEFYTKNIAYKAMYEEMAFIWKKQADKLYDTIYLSIKEEVTDESTTRGGKYKKKAATQKEIDMEMSTHQDYKAFLELNEKANDFEKKARTQEEFIKGLGKLDSILSLLQRASNTEMKFLYLET